VTAEDPGSYLRCADVEALGVSMTDVIEATELAADSVAMTGRKPVEFFLSDGRS
jgi:hypothetical protein